MRKIIIIPAKANSERFPHKNVKLFPMMAKLLKSLPNDYEICFVTDSAEIRQKATEMEFNHCPRSKWTTFRGVDSTVPIFIGADYMGAEPEDLIISVELTHIGLSIADIQRCVDLAVEKNSSTVLMAEAKYPRDKLLAIDEEGLVYNPNGTPLHTYCMTSQSHEKSFLPAGVFVNRYCDMQRWATTYIPRIRSVMAISDIDIDTPEDLLNAI